MDQGGWDWIRDDLMQGVKIINDGQRGGSWTGGDGDGGRMNGFYRLIFTTLLYRQGTFYPDGTRAIGLGRACHLTAYRRLACSDSR